MTVMAIHDEAQELLERILSTDVDPVDRLKALFRLGELGFAHTTVVDHACARDGKPLMLQVRSLYAHLTKHGRRNTHTAANVEFGSPDDPGYGPGKANSSGGA